MAEQGRRARRLRALPADASRETAETVLPELPRVGALDALLREVDSLRLTLETDLTVAAAAVESGDVQVAADILDSDREGLRAFEQRALDHVEELAAPARRRRLRVPAAPFVAAAAVAGFLLGVVPHTTPPSSPTVAINAGDSSPAASYNRLVSAVRLGEQNQALDAANTLHAQLLDVVAQAKSNPAAALTALQLLNSERHFLASVGGSSPALTQALVASQLLSNQILSALPVSVKTSVSTPPSTPPVLQVLPSPRSSSSSPKPQPAATSSPKPKASPKSSPAPAKPSPTPSSSPSSGTGLPRAPGFS